MANKKVSINYTFSLLTTALSLIETDVCKSDISVMLADRQD